MPWFLERCRRLSVSTCPVFLSFANPVCAVAYKHFWEARLSTLAAPLSGPGIICAFLVPHFAWWICLFCKLGWSLCLHYPLIMKTPKVFFSWTNTRMRCVSSEVKEWRVRADICVNPRPACVSAQHARACTYRVCQVGKKDAWVIRGAERCAHFCFQKNCKN